MEGDKVMIGDIPPVSPTREHPDSLCSLEFDVKD